MCKRPLSFWICFLLAWYWSRGAGQSASLTDPDKPRLEKRWLFEWHNLNDPKEVERMIARFPQARAAGYNGIVFSHNAARAKAAELTAAARQNGLQLVVTVMDGAKDRNYTEGVLCQDALFVVHDSRAVFEPDNPTRGLNRDFEDVAGNHLKSWGFQDDEGVTSFADHEIV